VDEPLPRRQLILGSVMIAVLLATVVVGAVAAHQGTGDDGRGIAAGGRPVGPPTTLARPPLSQPEGWEAMARSPLTGRAQGVTAWTGEELLVWSGTGATSDVCGISEDALVCGDPMRSDGAAYDPAHDRWRPMARSPLRPEPGSYAVHASAWTGSELVVWSGLGPEAAAYDPTTDSWRRLDPGPMDDRERFGSVWTGEHLFVLGGWLRDGAAFHGAGQPDALADGAAYDPAAGTWRVVPPAPSARFEPVLAWDGDRVLVLGGQSGSRAKEAYAFDPGTWRWTTVPAPPVDRMTAAVETPAGVVLLGTTGAALWDADARTWAELPAPPERPGPGATVPWLLPSVAWTGKEVLVVGTFGPASDEPLDGLALDVAARRWRRIPSPGPSARSGMATAWTGEELLLWGGAWYTGYGADPRTDGLRYRPGPGR
jgi:hypothetical protein